MASFTVLTGSALSKAIVGQGKAIATFTAREHQLAYSALNHVELHNDVKYLNALFDVTPVNYRAGLVSWAKAFGKVSFDATAKAFAYAKGKASDMEGALAVAPANYAKDANGAAKPAKSLMERVESAAKKVIEDVNATTDDKAFAKALNNFLAMHKRSLIKPVADKPAKGKAKLIKAKTEEAAPVAEAA